MSAGYLTSEMGIVLGDISLVSAAFKEWQGSIFEPLGWNVSSSSHSANASQGIGLLRPVSKPPTTQHLFVQSSGPWVAYFDNAISGTDAGPVMATLSRKFGFDAIRVVFATQNTRDLLGRPAFLRERAAYPLCSFEYFRAGAAKATGAYSGNDGGKWRHGRFGADLPDVGPALGEVSPANPFTLERLEAALAALHIRPFSIDWYVDGYVMVEKTKA